MNNEAEIFIDEFGNIHERDAELGRGGQGAVFRTRDPDIAIKLALDANGMPAESRELAEKLRRVRLLPVPYNLPLSMPAAILRHHAGYAMRLLEDMVPFKHFWPGGATGDPVADVPSWLARVPESVANELVHYVKTGGLRRRLLALYKCSSILSRLHGAGLVYGDVSPANAYISKNADSRAVWMIDADNLRFETERRGPGIYTPGFGAPELVRGIDGGRPRTDCHAFAAMAFWMLTLQHPFVGDYVENGDGVDWADEGEDQQDLTEKAHAGLVPWIDDEEDDTNATNKGLPRALVLTEDLRGLFQQTFGPGRVHPWRRPVIFHWPYFLARALDAAVPCPGCSMSYYDDWEDPGQRCPYCSAGRPAVLRATVSRQGAFADVTPLWKWTHSFRSVSETTLRVPHRVFFPFSMSDGDRDALSLISTDGTFFLAQPDYQGSQSTALTLTRDGQLLNLSVRAALPNDWKTNGFRLATGGASGRTIIFKFHEAVT